MVVLVVEDDDDLREMVMDALAGEGHEVVGAANGVVALAWLAEHRPGLILTDLRMPLLDGRALVRQCRATLGPQVPIVVMSAYAADLPDQEIATAFLPKPFAFGTLFALVRQYDVKG